MDGRTASLGLVPGLDDDHGSPPVKDGRRSVEHVAFMPFDIDFDQVEPIEATLGSNRIEAAQLNLQRLVTGAGRADPRGAGVGARRGHDGHGKFRHAIPIADCAADGFGLTQSVGGEGRFEGSRTARRRLDGDHPSRGANRAREGDSPFTEIGSDIAGHRAGMQEGEHRRVHPRRVEQRMSPARVERSGHIDEVAGAMQRKATRPVSLQPRQETLFPPPPNKARAERFRLAWRAQLPKRLQERHHGAKIVGVPCGQIPVPPMLGDFAMTLFDLKGRVAVVTGGNGGIGLGMARGLAAAGADVVVAARNAEKAKAAAAALGGKSLFIVLDVADEASCRAVIDQAAERFGRLDILVNNAGISIRKPPETYTAAEWHAVLDTNLTGAFFCSQAAHPAMKRSGGGKIINIGSMFALFGTGYGAPYAASKGALVQLTKSLAVAWAEDNIQVNAVLPGWIDTELTRDARQQVAGLHERVLARTPAGRWGVPEDLTGVAVFLASSASDFVTGAAIAVDGGFSAMG